MKCLKPFDVATVVVVLGCVACFVHANNTDSAAVICGNSKISEFQCESGEKCCNRNQVNGRCVPMDKDCNPKVRQCGSDWTHTIWFPVPRVSCVDTPECAHLKIHDCDVNYQLEGWDWNKPHHDCEKCVWTVE
jgi:hypothetical protein